MTQPGRHWPSAALLLLLSLAAYSNSFNAAFTLDSEGLILNDPRVQQVSKQSLFGILNEDYWHTISSGLYRPVVTLSWLLHSALLGNRAYPFGYHCFDFAFHALNVLLLWWLALAIFRRRLPAFFTAAIFALHPAA